MIAAVYFHEDSSGVTQIAPADDIDHPAWWLMRLAWGAHGNIDAVCMALVRRVLPENDGSIATRIFRPTRGKGAFFRGVADAADESDAAGGVS